MDKHAGFDRRVKESGFLERNVIGKSIVANTSYGATVIGHVVEIDDGFLVLNPHIGAVDYREGKEIIGPVKGNRYLEMVPGMVYTQVTEEDINRYCENVNRATQKRIEDNLSKNKPSDNHS